MNYTFSQLRIFSKVRETLSITRAAEELHLTQPAVSIQLKKFQAQFDLPLTEVVGRRLHFTDFGHEIADAADKILDEVMAIDARTHARKGKLTGVLKLSVVSTGKYVMPHLLSGFVNKHPELELKMDVTNKARVVQSLAQNEVDFALVSVLPAQLRLQSLELMKNKLYVVGNGQQQVRKTTAPQSLLETLPLIYREAGSGTRHVFEQFLLRNKLRVKMKMELTSNEAVKQAVLAGMGYSIMPLIGIKNELNSGELRIIPVKGFPILSIWYLTWLKDKQHSHAASAFLQYLKTEKANIIAERFKWIDQIK
ncbi:MAG: LysR family transcriptional regulator [Chitinophagaceae bacterium]|nr:LysR family transcriptional regulator [Chitinophagaceae bacterium]